MTAHPDGGVDWAQLMRDEVVRRVAAERERQLELWGDEDYPDGTGVPAMRWALNNSSVELKRAFADGHGSWHSILRRQAAAVNAQEPDSDALVDELVQLAALAQAWAEAVGGRAWRDAAWGSSKRD